MQCKVEDCDRASQTKLGYCIKHYKRFKRNENKGDNNPDNLQKFKSQAEHMKEHARMRKEKGDE